MRKSIFDIVSENVDIQSEVKRLLTMATTEKILVRGGYYRYTLFEFIDELCFRDWNHRGHFVNVEDFLDALKFDTLSANAAYDTDSLLTLIELIYNFWTLAEQMLLYGKEIRWCGNFNHLKDVMLDILSQYNHTVYIDLVDELVLVVEDKTEISAVAEIMPTNDLSLDVIKYNHRSLKGELKTKKEILLALAAELEPKRKDLQQINHQLCDDIFFMLNNLNIRHNNKSKNDKNYKEYVAKMRNQQLEKWYDELYQMMLIAFLLLDNTKRTIKIQELKEKIKGE